MERFHHFADPRPHSSRSPTSAKCPSVLYLHTLNPCLAPALSPQSCVNFTFVTVRLSTRPNENGPHRPITCVRVSVFFFEYQELLVFCIPLFLQGAVCARAAWRYSPFIFGDIWRLKGPYISNFTIIVGRVFHLEENYTLDGSREKCCSVFALCRCEFMTLQVSTEEIDNLLEHSLVTALTSLIFVR